MHHADLYRNLHRIHGNMVLSLLWGQLSSKTIPHVSSSAVFIHHSSDSRHAVLFRLSDFCGISSFPELAQPVRKTHGNRRLRLRHRTVHVYLCRNSRSCLRRTGFPRRHHASGPTGTSVLGCQPDAGGSLRNLSHELDSGNLCICSRSCTGMDL